MKTNQLPFSRKSHIVTLSVYLICHSTLAFASEHSDVYIGFKTGYQWAFDKAYQHSEPNGSVLGIYGGLQFAPSWRWEAGYQYHDELEADVTSVSVKTWLIETALRYDWHLQDNFSVYGRLGAAYWDMEKTYLSSMQLNGRGLSPLGEIGVNYAFNPNLDLSIGYQYVDAIGTSETGKYDSHALMLGLAYTFGSKTQHLVTDVLLDPAQDMSAEKTNTEVKHFPAQIISVTFNSDSIKLNSDTVSPLSDVASVLKNYPQANAVIVGHTDSTGSRAYNQTLSEKRAQSVVEHFITLGVSSEQLEWRGEGELHPIADNHSVEGRSKNRRVEVNLLPFQFKE